MRRGSVAPLTGNIAGFWCVVFHFGTRMESLLNGTEPSRTLKIASVPGKPYNEVSFISAKDSALLIRVAGHSMPLDSITGLPNCSGFTALIRMANHQLLKNICISYTRKIGTQWNKKFKRCWPTIANSTSRSGLCGRMEIYATYVVWVFP